MGRPPLGLKTTLVRLKPEVLARIKKVEKNVAAFLRNAAENELERREKKPKKAKKS